MLILILNFYLPGLVKADFPTNSIDFASPKALITILFFASLAYSTTNFALSASY